MLATYPNNILGAHSRLTQIWSNDFSLRIFQQMNGFAWNIYKQGREGKEHEKRGRKDNQTKSFTRAQAQTNKPDDRT